MSGYELTILLARGFRAVIDEVHARLDERGFSDVRPAHGFVFQRLTPSGATGNQLAAHLGISKQAASQMVDYLEEHGYVARMPHPRDGRGKIVVLSERGWACIRAGEAVFTEIEARWTALLGPERMRDLRADLRLLVSSTGEETHPSPFRPVW